MLDSLALIVSYSAIKVRGKRRAVFPARALVAVRRRAGFWVEWMLMAWP